MANTHPTVALHIMRPANIGFMGHAIVAPICGPRYRGAGRGEAMLSSSLAQGRIVSISRGSPPPKKR